MPLRRPDWMNAIPHQPDPYLDLSTVQTIVWWEIRRPLFNIYLFAIGMFSVIGMKLLMDHVVAPAATVSTGRIIIATFFYGVAANMIYAFGWAIELYWRRTGNMQARYKAVGLYWSALKFFCLLTTAPLWFALFSWLKHPA